MCTLAVGVSGVEVEGELMVCSLQDQQHNSSINLTIYNHPQKTMD